LWGRKGGTSGSKGKKLQESERILAEITDGCGKTREKDSEILCSAL